MMYATRPATGHSCKVWLSLSEEFTWSCAENNMDEGMNRMDT